MAGLVEVAQRIAFAAHWGQVDKAGQDYIGHPRRVAGQVAAKGFGEQAVAAAWLHDVLEDTTWTADDLREEGIPEDVIQAVQAVTKQAGESPEDYFRRVRSNPLAVIVKTADICDNTDPERLAALDEATRRRLTAKYARALTLLEA